MRGLAEAFAAAGFSVELPRLPGHGTSVDDMAATTWSDWSAAAEACFQHLRARCSKVVVAGLSMGGTLASWLATRHPEIVGLIVINPAIEPLAGAAEQARQTLDAGVERWPAVGGDIADPAAQEMSYDEVPVRSMLSLVEALEELEPKLPLISCPVLIFWSAQDHVVTNASSQLLAERVTGPAEQVTLTRSFHVATLDYEREEIFRRSTAFAEVVSA
jgi:carboxylesterase